MADHNPPSSLRVPWRFFSASQCPLGLLAWIALSGSCRSDYLRSNWVRTGLGIGAGSVVPLLVVSGAAMLGLWPDPTRIRSASVSCSWQAARWPRY